MVPGARIELATPAFSGRRSTGELPRHINYVQVPVVASPCSASSQAAKEPQAFCAPRPLHHLPRWPLLPGIANSKSIAVQSLARNSPAPR